MSAPHTFRAGPYEASEPGAYTDFDGESVVILGDDRRIAVVQGDDPEAVATAHLFAAAPDMLAALEYLHHALTGLRDILNRARMGRSATQASEVLAVVDAAIAKATGQ